MFRQLRRAARRGRRADADMPGGKMTATAATAATVDASIAAKGYAHPEALVTTNWLADHLGDAAVRIVESDEDVLLYDTGHIPGAIKIDWHADLNDPLVRD